MPAIRFPDQHLPGIVPSEGAGRLYNCVSEPLGDGRTVLHRAAGLSNFGTSAYATPRGMIEVDGLLYAAFATKLVSLPDSGGASTLIGNLNGTKKGFFARNNNSPPDKVFVDPDGNIATFTTGSVTNSYPDADLPAVNSVTDLDGYFIWTTGSGQIWASDLNSTAVNALSFTVAQSDPDGLLRGVRFAGRYYAFGTRTIEIYTNVGTSPFPLARNEVIPRGLAGPYAVTGFETGFSKGLFWVGDDNRVYRLDGYTPVPMSSTDLDRLIEAVEDKTELEMCAYNSGGHAYIQLSSATWTWVCDINNGGKWHERPSYLQTRSRISTTAFAFNKWLAGDTETGNIQEITRASRYEVADPLTCEVWSAPVRDYPLQSRVGKTFLEFATGVGEAEGIDPIGVDPSIEVSWSDDGGASFCTPFVRRLGRQAEGSTRVVINQSGRTRNKPRIYKVRFSDPTHFGLVGGEMQAA